LADGSGNLLRPMPLAYQAIADDPLAPRQRAPGFQCLTGEFQRTGRIVVGHSHSIHRHGCAGGQHVQQDQMRPVFGSLLESKRHQPVQVGQVGGDEDYGWMGPAIGASIRESVRHGLYLVRPQCAAERAAEMCRGAPPKVIWLTLDIGGCCRTFSGPGVSRHRQARGNFLDCVTGS